MNIISFIKINHRPSTPSSINTESRPVSLLPPPPAINPKCPKICKRHERDPSSQSTKTFWPKISFVSDINDFIKLIHFVFKFTISLSNPCNLQSGRHKHITHAHSATHRLTPAKDKIRKKKIRTMPYKCDVPFFAFPFSSHRLHSIHRWYISSLFSVICKLPNNTIIRFVSVLRFLISFQMGIFLSHFILLELVFLAAVNAW